MMQRLSSSSFPALSGPSGLKTRETTDPAIALCDAWAVVADVLTFYQERIANEGYLRTATERSSIIELGRLTGYSLRPGVSANVHLAYTIAKGMQATVDVGHRVRSVPAPGDLPQTFETAESLDASDAWNSLPPRLTRPQLIDSKSTAIFADGVSTNLKKNDPVLLITGDPPVLGRLSEVTVQTADKRTLLRLQVPDALKGPTAVTLPVKTDSLQSLVGLVPPLSRPPAAHPLDALRLSRSVRTAFTSNSDTTPSLLKTMTPAIAPDIYLALSNTGVAPDPTGELHALRIQAAPFGHNAPKKSIFNEKGVVVGQEEWSLGDSITIGIVIDIKAPDVVGGLAQFRIGESSWSLARRTSAIDVTVEKGADQASATIASPLPQDAVSLGAWSVQVTQPRRTPTLDFKFGPAPVTREINVAYESGAIAVTIDGAAPIIVPHGQSTSASVNGAQTFVSFGDSIEITDQRALAPDSTTVIQLDTVYDQIIPGSWVAIERPGSTLPRVIARVQDARKTSVTSYGLTGRVTELTLDQSWLDPSTDLLLSSVRGAVVSAQSEKLGLAPEPISDSVQGDRIELGDLYGGLQPGRWLIVQGERSDISNTPGVTAAELVMLGSVTQDVLSTDGTTLLSAVTGAQARPRAGEKTHTFLRLANKLSYSYKRDTTTIYGNVTRATNGETRAEVLGSGDAAVPNQSFILHASPLTYVTAPTAAGVQSTLVVTVNDIPWTEVETLAGAGPTDRVYTTSTNDAGVVTVAFGDGKNGSRATTGVTNIKAQYRSGIGGGGNVDGGEVSVLVTRPAGVQAIVNPIPASGGADPESRDEARRNVPVGTVALDRLVSASDYAALARTFAGVAKASAVQLRRSGKSLIGLTIAGSADAPAPAGSPLMVNLTSALLQAGSARQRFVIQERELILLVAGVTLTPAAGISWDNLAIQVRSVLLAAFGFDQRALAQSVALSEFVGVIHKVPGVAAVTVTQFDGISRDDVDTAVSLRNKLSAIASAVAPNPAVAALPGRLDATGTFLPAQLAILSPDVPDTLILSQAQP
jgi:predicted phage baseplate assembly protein